MALHTVDVSSSGVEGLRVYGMVVGMRDAPMRLALVGLVMGIIVAEFPRASVSSVCSRMHRQDLISSANNKSV